MIWPNGGNFELKSEFQRIVLKKITLLFFCLHTNFLQKGKMQFEMIEEVRIRTTKATTKCNVNSYNLPVK